MHNSIKEFVVYVRDYKNYRLNNSELVLEDEGISKEGG